VVTNKNSRKPGWQERGQTDRFYRIHIIKW